MLLPHSFPPACTITARTGLSIRACFAPSSRQRHWQRMPGLVALATALASSLVSPVLAQATPAAMSPATATAAKARLITPSKTTTSPACPALLQHRFLRLQDEKPQDLCQYAGNVLVIVNTASFCGFTRQYDGLEKLHVRYKDRGVVVLGFPSNDFSQESGSNQEIASFCENTFGVKFPMFAKSSVTGPQAHPLFKQLAILSGQVPRWNFQKYVVSRDGRQVLSFASSVEPQDPRLLRSIDNLLQDK